MKTANELHRQIKYYMVIIVVRTVSTYSLKYTFPGIYQTCVGTLYKTRLDIGL